MWVLLCFPRYVHFGKNTVEKTAQPTETDGLSEAQRALIDLAKSISPEQAVQVLRVLKAILGDDP